MKKILLLLVTGFILFNGQHPLKAQTKPKTTTYGKMVLPGKLVKAEQLPLAIAGKDSLQTKVQGVVQNVCQAKGCWMDIKLSDDTRMKVRFRNYGFFVPKDLGGKTVVFQGTAYQELISVADQQHYLKDAGKPESEIKAITSPKKEITFIADGVQVL